ncbi:MAG: hypothetical protein HWN80_14175 [Candidatus Lokiarchaeota archaeon]|nr:hypothetical protein [Candidatus Lokiarchaeota archaeon]
MSSINKREIIQSKKTNSKEEGKNQELVKIWRNRQTRAFWIPSLRINEWGAIFK